MNVTYAYLNSWSKEMIRCEQEEIGYNKTCSKFQNWLTSLHSQRLT